MSPHKAYGLFQVDGKGPTLRASFADLNEAKEQAQKLAETEGEEFFMLEDDMRWCDSSHRINGLASHATCQSRHRSKIDRQRNITLSI